MNDTKWMNDIPTPEITLVYSFLFLLCYRMESGTKYLPTGSGGSDQSTCVSASCAGTNGLTRSARPGSTTWRPSKVIAFILVGGGCSRPIVMPSCPLRKSCRESKEMGRQQGLLGLQPRLARSQPMHEEGQTGPRQRSLCRPATCACQDNQSCISSAYNVFMGWTAAKLHG